MAFFQINMFSPALGFPVDLNVFIPTPKSDDCETVPYPAYFTKGVRFPVLYLLHGAYGDHTDWGRLTSIEKYADQYKLAVIMPAAANSFYQNMYRGGAYLTYLTQELPAFVEKYFPVRSREKNYVAGASMGGYGALRIALARPDKFAACASLSGAIDIEEIHKMQSSDESQGPFRWSDIFEFPDKIEGSEADLFARIEELLRRQAPLPRIYQTVGTEDFIYHANVTAREKLEKLEKLGLDYTYEEYPGIHDWYFWDAHIQDVLRWLNLTGDTVKEGGDE